MRKNITQRPFLILARYNNEETAERFESNARHIMATCSGTKLTGRFSELETNARWYRAIETSRKVTEEHVSHLEASRRFDSVSVFKDPGIPISAAVIKRLTRS